MESTNDEVQQGDQNIDYCNEQLWHYTTYKRKRQQHMFRLKFEKNNYILPDIQISCKELVDDLIILCKKEEEIITQILDYWRQRRLACKK